jgi:hypothetical protein
MMEEIRKDRKWTYNLLRVLLFCLGCAIILILPSALAKGLPGASQPVVSVAVSAGGALLITLQFIRWEGQFKSFR